MLVGPALILTTVVLACGLVVTVFSDLPSLRLFGWLSAFAMVAALVADLLILRPTSMFLINLSQRIRGPWSREAGGVGRRERVGVIPGRKGEAGAEPECTCSSSHPTFRVQRSAGAGRAQRKKVLAVSS